MQQFFETKVKYDKMQDNGTEKKVTESYIIDALSFTEAEKRTMEQLNNLTSGEFDIKDITRRDYREIIVNNEGDKWYKVQISVDEPNPDTGKIKHTKYNYLLNAANTDEATKRFKKFMEDTSWDYSIKTVTETKILDYFAYKG